LRLKVRRLVAEELLEMLDGQVAKPNAGIGHAMTDGINPPGRIGTASSWRSLAHSASAPAAASAPATPTQALRSGQLPPPPASMMTRQLMSYRNYNGGFVSDPPPWQVLPTSGPLVPPRYSQLSRRLWASTLPEYADHPQATTSAQSFTDPKVVEPVTRAFMNPRDDFVLYREEMVKPGNKIVMRKGGGSMHKTVPK